MATRTRKAKADVEQPPVAEDGVSQQLEPEEIARRAYAIYESGEGGDPLEHWLRAEQELVIVAGA